MRRDVVGLGVVLAVGGLAYGSSRGVTPASLAPVPVASILAVPPQVSPSPSTRPAARPAPRRFVSRETAAAIARYVREAAARYRVSEALVAAVISVESEFDPHAVSHRGARGLMQLMPGTAALLGVRDAFDPRENVDAGARHLRDLLDRFANDVSLALAAYNAGAQAVVKHGGVPPYPETRAFVTRVLGRLGTITLPPPAPALAHASGPTPPVTPRLRLARHTVDRLRSAEVASPSEAVMIEPVVIDEPVIATLASAPPAPAPAPAPVEPPAPAEVTMTVPPALTRHEAP